MAFVSGLKSFLGEFFFSHCRKKAKGDKIYLALSTTPEKSCSVLNEKFWALIAHRIFLLSLIEALNLMLVVDRMILRTQHYVNNLFTIKFIT